MVLGITPNTKFVYSLKVQADVLCLVFLFVFRYNKREFTGGRNGQKILR